MTFAVGQKQPILEIDYEKVLRGMELTYPQFVDLCILCGCDYCSSIKGIGPKTALKYIKQFGSLERVLDYLRREKRMELPSDWRPQVAFLSLFELFFHTSHAKWLAQRIPVRLSKQLEDRTYSSRAEGLPDEVQLLMSFSLAHSICQCVGEE